MAPHNDDKLSYPFSTLSPPDDHHRNQGRHLEGVGAFPLILKGIFLQEKQQIREVFSG